MPLLLAIPMFLGGLVCMLNPELVPHFPVYIIRGVAMYVCVFGLVGCVLGPREEDKRK